ncbi:carboxypeptidase-like regulatory domain-containing protein [Flavobacterium davisii]|uniref:Carboxypeptidase-like regulatory domain-containing protein n=1 Tax=Flavobacterium columnare TaxID=996 RepID=A0A8G0KTJ4_9FLAO|nr:carboxypeptidase-like regulatory domain-containing protein [Flavobacterium davisii]QYS89786.1 carboxypeptidase-like regulatory domain-containing protein [Flavobacterium davisii]
MQKKVSFFIILFFTLFTNAQTKISGIVYDDQNLPLPFANIYFKGNKTGISSDVNGVFHIESPNDYKAIIVKYAGFEDTEVELKTASISNLKIVMSTTKQLKEVVVVAKPKKHLKKEENPAYKILQQIWKNKKKNGLLSSKSYQYTRYTSIANGLSNLDSVFLKRVLGNHYDSVIKIAEQKRIKQIILSLLT